MNTVNATCDELEDYPDHVRPCIEMYRQSFHDAITAICNGHENDWNRKRDILWLESDGHHLFGFLWYCDILKLNPTTWRAKVARVLKRRKGR